MTGLILKLSFNFIGDPSVTGGICGSFFFIKKNTIVTANHIFNKKAFIPNAGYKKCQFWLIIQPKTIIEIKSSDLIEHSEIDTTIIRLNKDYPIKVRKLLSKELTIGSSCFNEGFVGGQMPNLEVSWGPTGLLISSCDYGNTVSNQNGTVKSKRSLTVDANDIKIKDIHGIETSYGGVIGMSGGPLIDKKSDEIIGLMSIGLPQDVQVKTSLFAISIEEILKRI